MVLGAGPAHALYFGFYEMTKETLTKFTSHNHLNYGLFTIYLQYEDSLTNLKCCFFFLVISGSSATVLHDAISTPTEVIKQRMQMYNSPYTSVIKCIRDVYLKEGVHAFYRSYGTQLVMNIPYQTIHFTTYEFLQNLVRLRLFIWHLLELKS